MIVITLKDEKGFELTKKIGGSVPPKEYILFLPETQHATYFSPYPAPGALTRLETSKVMKFKLERKLSKGTYQYRQVQVKD